MVRHKTRKSGLASSTSTSAAAAAAGTDSSAGDPRRHPMAIDLDPPETLTLTPSPSPPDPPSPPPPIAVPDDSPAAVLEARKPPIKRKKPTTGRKPKPVTAKQLAAIQSKLDFLDGNLRPFPFVPGAAPDLTRHAGLFRALGLWDFLHLNLPADPLRPDLIAPFIAGYNPKDRRSEVHGIRIPVSRAHIARALELPSKKSFIPVDSDLPLFAGEEAVAVLSEFILNWIVVLEDAGVIPPAVMAATELVKEGQPYKVDWAGLVWAMVEKDLQEAPKSGDCYYAAHLQRLIKHQHAELFEAEEVVDSDPEPEMLVEVVPSAEEEEEDAGNASPGGEEDGADNGAPDEAEDGNANSNVNADVNVDVSSLEGFQDVGTDENGPQLSLRLGSEVDAILSLDDCDMGVEPSWLAGGNDVEPSHYLQRCSMNDLTAMDCDNFGKEGEDKGGRAEENYGGEFDTKFTALGRLNSTDLLQAVSDANVSYDMPQHTVHGDFLSVGTETHKNMAADSHPASPFSFGNSCKRHIDEIDDDEVHPFSHLNPQKRVRGEGVWEGTTSTPGDCFEQSLFWIHKSKMVNMQTQQAYNNAQMELQYASNMLQQKDQVIQTLEKARMEEAQKREAEASRFEHELRLLTRVVSGYKRALRVSRNAFEEYRKKFPQAEEPYYQDVEGAGGLVLSALELERLQLMKEEEEMHDAAEEERLENEKKMRDAAEEQFLENEKKMCDAVKEEHLEKEEEMRDAVKVEPLEKEEEMRDAAEVEQFEEEEEMRHTVAAKLISNFAKGWCLKFEECEKRIGNMTTKFMKLKEDLNGLKEIHANTKVSETK